MIWLPLLFLLPVIGVLAWFLFGLIGVFEVKR